MINYPSQMKYGLLAGTILIVFKFIRFASFDEVSLTAILLDYISLIGLAAVCYYAVYQYRENENHGLITLGNAFLLCMYISLIASIMIGGFHYIHAKYIDPSRSEKLIQKTVEYMKGKNFSETEMKQAIANARAYYTPMSQAISGVAVIIYGLFISLVVAAIAKREKKDLKV
jgi:hypothetical protein